MKDFLKLNLYIILHKLNIYKQPFLKANPHIKYFKWLKIARDWKKPKSTMLGMVEKYKLNLPHSMEDADLL